MITFGASCISGGSWGSSENWQNPKTHHSRVKETIYAKVMTEIFCARNYNSNFEIKPTHMTTKTKNTKHVTVETLRYDCFITFLRASCNHCKISSKHHKVMLVYPTDCFVVSRMYSVTLCT